MTLSAYKILHILGIMMVMMSLGGSALHATNGGTKESNASRALLGAMQGGGLLLILVAGFGMLARLGIMGSIPGWIWAKLAIWVVFGAAIAIPNRKPELAKALFFALPLLGAVSGWLAIYKPF